MSLKFCVLGSGSSGNAILVGSPTTRILIDAGFSLRELTKRLGQLGISPGGLQGVCFSHEHSDHLAGAPMLQKKHRTPLYINRGTLDAIASRGQEKFTGLDWTLFTTGSSFSIGDLTVHPFSVPHDAYEPVGFIISSGHASIGIATDLGTVTPLITERLGRCHAVILEANHDLEMLQQSRRPWSLKQRIMGRQGHLSNDKTAALIGDIVHRELTHVYLAHISEDCNCPKHALNIITAHLAQSQIHHVKISLTYPDRISDIWDFESRLEIVEPQKHA